MTTDNPYQTPQTNSTATHSQNNEFSHLDFAKIKKLYHRSSNVGAITALLAIGSVALTALAITSVDYDAIGKVIFIALAVFYAVAVVGLYKRTSWGRILGIITSILSLINIPIGTIIGIAGLFAFFKSPELFGQNRLTHKDLKKEFKLRKNNKNG